MGKFFPSPPPPPPPGSSSALGVSSPARSGGRAVVSVRAYTQKREGEVVKVAEHERRPPGSGMMGEPTVVDVLGQGAGATRDFLGNYLDMRKANVKNSDKYFHCKANCEAAQRGPAGEKAALHLSNAREWWDRNVKGYPQSDSEEDQEANRTGRSVGRSGLDCRSGCGRYRPNGLPPRY